MRFTPLVTVLFATVVSGAAVAGGERSPRHSLPPPVDENAAASTITPTPPSWPSSRSSPARWPYLVIAGGVVLLGILVVRLRDRTGPNFEDVPSIDIVATRALTAKTKVMLVETKGREMLLSVTDRGAELLSEWLDEEPAHELPPHPETFARPLDELTEFDGEHEEDLDDVPEDEPTSPDLNFEIVESPPAPGESEAIRGLLELRKHPSTENSRPPWTRMRRSRR